ncbi:MAG: diadenylate cyclase CdaA [Oscillospiraceae bacterium]|nr:diadenylate cyclase CdaA [Oscillospiraceae bacterium]
MDSVISVMSDGLRYLRTIGLTDAIDILIIGFLIYKLLRMLNRTNTMRLAKGIGILLIVLWLSSLLNLRMLNFLLAKALEIGLIAVVIIFQPELRRALEKLGSSSWRGLISGGELQTLNIESAITQTVLACSDMSKSRTGAIIVFERSNSLDEVIRTGTVVNADVTGELLKNIFFVKAPLHDGAIIVRNGRIVAAGCMLPMSYNMNLSKELGMRHRAGIGMSEQSDAVIVIVSEETGAISVAVEGMLKRHLSPETVETLLKKELVPEMRETTTSKIKDFFKVKDNV